MRAIALTGPTASGKTALSIALAHALGCEIISLDSMQIYRGMDIGTAKATDAERAEIPHYMLDIVEPTDPFSAEDYRAAALECARDITSRGLSPLFVGGTGLYLDTLMRGSSPLSPPSDPVLRDRLMKEGETEEGRERLYSRLMAVDPDTARKTHKNNLRRVVRALEIYELTGLSKTYFDEASRVSSPDISVLHFTLDFSDRELLYSRVDLRVDEMIGEGLVDEARDLYTRGMLDGDSTAAQAIGYKELLPYIRGECDLDTAISLIKLSTRRYAKRQLTWFRHNADAIRILVDRDGKIRKRDDLLSEILPHATEFLARLDC